MCRGGTYLRRPAVAWPNPSHLWELCFSARVSGKSGLHVRRNFVVDGGYARFLSAEFQRGVAERAGNGDSRHRADQFVHGTLPRTRRRAADGRDVEFQISTPIAWARGRLYRGIRVFGRKRGGVLDTGSWRTSHRTEFPHPFCGSLAFHDSPRHADRGARIRSCRFDPEQTVGTPFPGKLDAGFNRVVSEPVVRGLAHQAYRATSD